MIWRKLPSSSFVHGSYTDSYMIHIDVCVCVCCSLRQKIACKVSDEHYQVKDLPPPSEAVARVAARALPSSVKHCKKLLLQTQSSLVFDAGVRELPHTQYVQLVCRLVRPVALVLAFQVSILLRWLNNMNW